MSELATEDAVKVVRGAGTTFLGTAVGRGLMFASQLLVARMIGADAFGVFSLGLALLRIGEVLGRLGLNTGGMRFVSMHRDDGARLRAVVVATVRLGTIAGVAAGVVLYIAAPGIARAFGAEALADVLRVFAVALPFAALTTTGTSLLQGFHTTREAVIARDVVQPATNIVLLVVLAFTAPGLTGAAWALCLSYVVAVGVAGGFLARRVRGHVVATALPGRELLKYSLPLLLVGVLHYLLTWSDTLLLGYLTSPREVGLYRAAAQVPLALSAFLVAVNSIYAPLAADLHQRGDLPRLRAIFRASARWVTCATVPGFVLLVVSGAAIMALFGPDYVVDGVPILIVLAGGQLVNAATGGVGFTLTMTGRPRLELVNSLGLLAVSIAGSLALIPLLGALGAAVASSFAVVAINVVRTAQVYRLYGMSPISRETALLLTPALAAVVFVTTPLDTAGWPGALVRLALLAGAIAVSVRGMVRGDERAILAQRLRRRRVAVP